MQEKLFTREYGKGLKTPMLKKPEVILSYPQSNFELDPFLSPESFTGR